MLCRRASWAVAHPRWASARLGSMSYFITTSTMALLLYILRMGWVAEGLCQATCGLATLARRGEGAELLHHPQRVPRDPLLDDPAARDAVDVDRGDLGPPAGGGDAQELAGVGAARGPAAHHLVPLRDQVVDAEAIVGE